MRGVIGWLLLLPLILAFWLTMTIANACAKRESGSWRLLGVLTSLAIGSICIFVGYGFAIEGFTEVVAGGYQIVKYPVIGWISMVGGGIIALLGTWTALVGTREEIELREDMEEVEKERKQQEQVWAKEEAKKILEQGKIDDFELVNHILEVLDKTRLDWGAIRLQQDLEDLKGKQVKRRKGNTKL